MNFRFFASLILSVRGSPITTSALPISLFLSLNKNTQLFLNSSSRSFISSLHGSRYQNLCHAITSTQNYARGQKILPRMSGGIRI